MDLHCQASFQLFDSYGYSLSAVKYKVSADVR